MRQIFSALLILFILSCNKEIRQTKKEITGTWEFETFSGYPFNNTLPPGKGRIIVIRKNGDFERRQHDTVVFKGSYTIKKKEDCLERDNDLLFSTSEDSYKITGYIEIVNEKLSISSSNCLADGGTVYYRRIQQ